MRTFAIIGVASIAALIAASSGAWAWTAEAPAQQVQGVNAADLSDPDNFKELQDKVNGKTDSQSGFQFYGGVNAGSGMGLSGANPYGVPAMGSSSAFSYSPNPGFRGGGN
ncbi:MAG: hypothetical protein ACLPJW_01095 [Rhodomicrobium sp.]